MAISLSLSAAAPAGFTADALVIAVSPGRGKSVTLAAHGLSAALARKITDALGALDATGKPGEVTKIGPVAGVKASTVVGVGVGDLGKKLDAECLRRAAGDAIRSLAGSRKVAVITAPQEAEFRATAEGAGLGAYSFDTYKSKENKSKLPPASVVLLVPSVTSDLRAALSQAQTVVDAVHQVRNWVNTPPNELSPVTFAESAKKAVAGLPIKVTVWDEKALKRDGCGGILAVGQGSSRPPRLVKLEYKPARAKGHIAFVGKGITFDTGGYSIKPFAGMHEMTNDMSGAAAVIATVKAIAELGLPIRVTGWAPMAENLVSSTAQRPGDVFTSYDGKTVEVLNTDAEGRLILIDAIAMAAEEKPDLLVDVATLTGASIFGLGYRIGSIMSTTDEVREEVYAASKAAGEEMWPMPLPSYMGAQFDSFIADWTNLGEREGGSLSAGMFLSKWVPEGQPWAHLDIAGPAYARAPYGYVTKGGTGVAVRTFVELARERADR